MTSRPLIRAASVSGLAQAVANAGISPHEAFRGIGLSLAEISDPHNWLPLYKVAAAFEASPTWLGRNSAGLELGASTDPRDLGLLPYLSLKAPTLRASARSFQRYIRVFADGADVELLVEGDRAVVSLVNTAPDIIQRRQLSAWALAAMTNAMREMIGPSWTPQEVHFEDDRPDDIAPYEKHFSATLLFDRRWNGLVFESEKLSTRPRTADPRLHQILTAYADLVIDGRPHEDGVVEHMRVFVVQSLGGGYPAIDAAAQELGVSVRTLQRRLREIGTDYTELVDEIRRELAHSYLDNEALSLKEISHLLGYSQPSAFNRAWRRWTGGTPQEYRHRRQV